MLKLVVGPLQTNCYILYEDGKCLIVDPGDEENNIIKQIEKLKLVPVAILLTHNHFDHTGAANSLSEFFKKRGKLCILKKLNYRVLNLSLTRLD